ncbi:MAG: flagella basal body P-ring formation protein FlgA [Acidobacteriaceae bacterium]
MMLRRTILGVWVTLIGGCAFGQPACTARTPEQALPPGWTVQFQNVDSEAASSRYRLVRVVLDPALQRRWAFIGNCAHPEWPLQVVAVAPAPAALHAPNASSAAQAALVPAGRVPHRTVAVRAAVLPQPSPLFPAVRMSQGSSAPVSSAVTPLVRAGDRVHLWSSETNVRLEIEVVALEYGRAGQVIRLRRVGQGTLLAGVVVGKDSAELMP